MMCGHFFFSDNCGVWKLSYKLEHYQIQIDLVLVCTMQYLYTQGLEECIWERLLLTLTTYVPVRGLRSFVMLQSP